jgi:hypothetical protein
MTIKHRYGSGVGVISDRAAGAAARNGLAHDFTPACTVFVGGSRKTLHQSIIGRYWPKADMPSAAENVLSGVKRISKFKAVMSAFDPKRTSLWLV